MTVVVTEGSDDSGEQVADAIETVVEELGEVVSDAIEELTDVVEEIVNDDEPPAPIVAPAVAAAPEIDYDRIISGVANELERRESEREPKDEIPDGDGAIEDDEPPVHGSFFYKKRTSNLAH